MRPFIRFITAHDAPVYFTVTFAVSWGAALLVIGGGGPMLGTTPDSDPRFAGALAAMLIGPALAGPLLTAIVYGRPGLREYATRLTTWSRGAAPVLAALLTAPLAMGAVLLVLSLASPAFRPGLLTSEAPMTILRNSLAVGLAAGLIEELGWTGFAVPALRRRYSVDATGFILGLMWSAWHLLPQVWARRAAAGELSDAVYVSLTAVSLLAGYLTAFRILMVRVYDATRSLPLAMLMHVSLTASLLALNPEGLAGIDLQAYSFALSAILWVVVAAPLAARRRIA